MRGSAVTTKFRFDKLTEEQRALLLSFPDADVSEIKHVLKTGITERPKCLVCEKPASWSNTRKKYGSFCSKDCAFSPKGLAFSKETAKQTCLQKYGVEHSSQNVEVRQRISQAHLDHPVARTPFIDTLTDEQRTFLAPFAGASVAEMKHVLANQLTTRPPCAVCGAPTHFNDTSKAYTKFCGESCRRSPEGRQIERDVSRRTSLERYGVEHPFAADAVKAAIKQTCQERYGADSYTESKDFSDKKQQWLDEHGVKNAMQLPELRKKMSEISSANAEERFIKIRETCLDRYGFENPSLNAEVKAKILETSIRNDWDFFLEKLKETEVEAMFSVDEYLNNKSEDLKYRCTVCGKIFNRNKKTTNVSRLRCMHCASKFDSLGEQEVFRWAETLGEEIKVHHRERLSDGKMREIDIFFPRQNVGIEYNGLWHHSELNKDSSYHQEKAMFWGERGVRLFQIWEHDWRDPRKKDILCSIIANALKKSERIFARECDVVELEDSPARKFLSENHLQGMVNSSVRYGLMRGEELVAVMTLGKPRFSQDCEWELLRFANKKGAIVVGGFSRLWAAFVRKRSPLSVLSYRDLSVFNLETSLNKENFLLKKISPPSYFYFMKDKKGDFVTVSRYSAQKHNLESLLGERFDTRLTEAENMEAAGFLRVYDAGQAVHVWRSPSQ